jgi:hypothetical protein
MLSKRQQEWSSREFFQTLLRPSGDCRATRPLGQRAGMSLERQRAITLTREYVARWDPRELFRGVRESTR